jgi:hypothetical protein
MGAATNYIYCVMVYGQFWLTIGNGRGKWEISTDAKLKPLNQL